MLIGGELGAHRDMHSQVKAFVPLKVTEMGCGESQPASWIADMLLDWMVSDPVKRVGPIGGG